MRRPAPIATPTPDVTRRRAGATLIGLALGLGLIAIAGCGRSEADAVLVLARRGDATSAAIARAYADRRGIAANRVLALSLSTPHGQRVIDAERFAREIAAPIERHLALHDAAGEVRILVTTRGLPLRVRDCGEPATGDCREASVDAALAQLGRTPEGRAFASVPNPLFGALEPVESVLGPPTSGLRFLVARLTAFRAPSDATDTVPPALVALLERGARAPRIAPGAWRIAGARIDVETTLAARLLLEPITRYVPRTDGTETEPDSPHALLLARGGPAQSADAPPLAPPGLVFSLAGTPASDRWPRRRAAAAPFDARVEEALARGATSISLHLADPTLGEVFRPGDALTAWARGAPAAEAHFRALPRLGGSQVLVGDPLARIEPATGDGAARRADDLDGDGIPDAEDNCPRQPNPDQRDTNGDGYGNRCDADVDDDGMVDSSEGAIYPLSARGDLEAITLTARNGPYDPDHDLDGDGRVDERDLVIARLALGGPPGR